MRLALPLLLLVACDATVIHQGQSPSGPGPVQGPGATDLAWGQQPRDMADPAPQPTAYPQGPYGNQLGDTLGDLTAPGYRADGTWSSAISLSDVRAGSACECMILTLGATWCSACQYEQPDLVAAVSSDPALCVVGVLQEGATRGVMAERADVDDWVGYYHQNFVVLQGTPEYEDLMFGYGSSVALPFTLIVKPQTMEVLDNVQGYASDLHTYARSLCGY
jgi:hypothetical protein